MAVIYEVTVRVRSDVAEAFLAWLRAHVEEVIALPGFEGADLEAVEDDSATEKSWCVRYRLLDRMALDAYLREHAPRMRGDGVARFGDAFRAERRVLSPLGRWLAIERAAG